MPSDEPGRKQSAPARRAASGSEKSAESAPARAERLRPDPVGQDVEGYTDDEWEFARACEEYRKRARRKFLAASEYLAVARSLGYRKVEPGEHKESA
jgi:hypothetical protein